MYKNAFVHADLGIRYTTREIREHTMHDILMGIVLGWGAAIPLGPLNLEMIRRNLSWGTRFGVTVGLGACTADLTYLGLLLVGALTLLQHHIIFESVGFLSAIILGWFGYQTLRLPKFEVIQSSHQQTTPLRPWRHWLQGYLMALLNPYAILFWSSISIQIAAIGLRGKWPAIDTGLGVLLGTVSWVFLINFLLHHVRDRIPKKALAYLNYVGGIILLVFAALGLWHAFTF